MRLIDADKLVDMLYDNEFATLCPLDEVSGVIDACPTVGAVIVTRCEDCVFSQLDGWACGGTALMPQHRTFPNSFCDCGTRKDEANET